MWHFVVNGWWGRSGFEVHHNDFLIGACENNVFIRNIIILNYVNKYEVDVDMKFGVQRLRFSIACN